MLDIHRAADGMPELFSGKFNVTHKLYQSPREFSTVSPGVYPSKYRAKALQAPLFRYRHRIFLQALPLLPKHLRSCSKRFCVSMGLMISIYCCFSFLFMRVKPLFWMYSATPAGTRPLISSPYRLFSRTIVDETGKNSMFCTVKRSCGNFSFTSSPCVTSVWKLSLSRGAAQISAAAKMRSG